MQHPKLERGLRVASWIVLVLLLLIVVASLLPLVETDVWWIRFLDFPRVQFAVALIILLAVLLALRRLPRTLGIVAVAAGLLGLGYQVFKLHSYIGAVSSEIAVGLEFCPTDASLSLMVANVQKRNEQAEEFLKVVSAADPDVLLVLETDAWWEKHLQPLRATFSHFVQHIPEEHAAFGMHLFSQRELLAPEFRFLFDAYTPSIFTGLSLPDGAAVQLLGLHPRPPQAWSQPTTMRDAHLLTAALEARGSDIPTILAGDFNAVPWERVNRRAMRIGGLLDPRVGRGLYPTFRTGSVLVSWPIDQILFQEDLILTRFDTLPTFGSDHYPIIAELCHTPELSFGQVAPTLEPDDLEEAENTIAAAVEVGGSDE